MPSLFASLRAVLKTSVFMVIEGRDLEIFTLGLPRFAGGVLACLLMAMRKKYVFFTRAQRKTYKIIKIRMKNT